MNATAIDALLDERALSKLRWRCRRGLLENDLFINDLLDLLLVRKEPHGDLAQEDVTQVLGMLRAARLPVQDLP
jgi:antitoxin CptB